MALIYCPECGTQVSDKAQACIKCAYPIGNVNQINVGQPQQYSKQHQSQFNSTNNGIQFSEIKNLGLDYYYELDFEAIHKSNESYKGNWNWYAFFFSWIWLFTKGAWAWALTIIIANYFGSIFLKSFVTQFCYNSNNFSSEDCLFFGNLTVILYSLFIALILGNKGTMIYYNVKLKNKQF